MAGELRPRPGTEGPPRPRKPESPTAARAIARAVALRDVLKHAVAVYKESRKHSGSPASAGTGRIVALALCVPALAFCVYSYVARPQSIWGPKLANVSPVLEDANVRFTMFLLSQRIRSQYATKGTLPASLAGLGAIPPGITYKIVADSVFELRGEVGRQVLVLRSDEPPKAFLGDAPRYITGRAQ